MTCLNAPPTTRLKIAVRGAVQGVGFRPFVHRLATELGLAGWVNNSSQGVFIEAEGPRASLDQFLLRLRTEKPPRSFIESLESWWLDAAGYAGFEIRPSETGGGRTAIIMPDLATCPDCLREIFDPQNRRHLYPFTNCTHCGPRFSIVESLPYDRANTSMKQFVMCPECAQEYGDPANRRFHAQPNACPKCGPHLELWDAGGTVLATHQEALLLAAKIIREGKIVALKGIGGFQLMADARNEEAVHRLRERKQREEKPFAVMYPSLDAVREDCRVSDVEARLLASPESPIVLLQRTVGRDSVEPSNSLAPQSGEKVRERGLFPPGMAVSKCARLAASSVAPGNPNLGVMLPYSPLHHLLMSELKFPVVATSGNLSDEPICIDERESLQRLRNIADTFLVHNRPIVRHVDDSVVRVVLGREQVLRRARGYAPLPVRLADGKPATALDTASPILAVGGHLKNTVALAIGPQVFVSQHIGDLETVQSYEAFLGVINDFQRLYEAEPRIIASDGHPDYLSTQFARSLVGGEPGLRGVSVQHHIAHVFACAAENELAPPLLGVSWDGTGHGSDGTVWGGEFFLVTEKDCRRVAHLRQFRLPGGEQAIKEPRRAMLGMLYEVFGEEALAARESPPLKSFAAAELAGLTGMLKGGINSPLTSSAGRLFDAVAAFLGIRQIAGFEGQAAMELEFSIDNIKTDETYSFELESRRRRKESLINALSSRRFETPYVVSYGNELLDNGPPGRRASPIQGTPCQDASGDESMLVVDWRPMVKDMLADVKRHPPVGLISAKFHNMLAEVIVAVAQRIGQPRVALSGGCFQNRYLTERTVARLEQEGFRPYWHQRIPPNDGGIALGQIVATLMGLSVDLHALSP
jgi:hydrogenase maturation protein HypF